MNRRNNHKVTAADVFGSIKFSAKRSEAPARPWPEQGFAMNECTHTPKVLADDYKVIRSAN